MGFLYVRSGLIDSLEPPFLDLHSAKWTARDRYEVRADARRFENWECNYSAKVGLGAAVEYALDIGPEAVWERVRRLAESLRGSLAAIPGVMLHDLGQTRCGIVSFSLGGHDAFGLQAALDGHNINVSVSKPEDTLLDMNQRKLTNFIRASVHYYNTEQELETFCNYIENH